MTELEKHLVAGLTKLSAQYEAEQKQQQEQALQQQAQIKALLSQVNSLSQRVESLTKLHNDSETKLRQDLNRVFSSLSAQLKELSES